MADSKKYRWIENPRGRGDIYSGGKNIAKVSYNLNVQQEILVHNIGNEIKEVEGLKSMNGHIAVLEGDVVLWSKGKLILHMEDGRKIDFFIRNANPTNNKFQINNKYQIQPSGDFY